MRWGEIAAVRPWCAAMYVRKYQLTVYYNVKLRKVGEDQQLEGSCKLMGPFLRYLGTEYFRLQVSPRSVGRYLGTLYCNAIPLGT